MEKIQVRGTLPSMAYFRLDEAPDEEEVLSEHVPTWRGLKNAIKAARNENKHYTETNGNAAARDVYIAALGVKADDEWWQGLIDVLEDGPLDEVTIQRLNESLKKRRTRWKPSIKRR